MAVLRFVIRIARYLCGSSASWHLSYVSQISWHADALLYSVSYFLFLYFICAIEKAGHLSLKTYSTYGNHINFECLHAIWNYKPAWINFLAPFVILVGFTDSRFLFPKAVYIWLAETNSMWLKLWFSYDVGCAGYMNPGTLTKGTDESYTTPKRKPSPLWVYVTSSSTAATKVLSSAASSSGSVAAGLGEASLVSILHSLFVIVLVLIIIFGVAVVVVCVVRRHYDHSGTISASSLAPKLPAADNQRSCTSTVSIYNLKNCTMYEAEQLLAL